MSNLTESLNEAGRLVAAHKYPVLRTLREDPELHRTVLKAIVMPALAELERVTRPRPWLLRVFGASRSAPEVRL
jgi:hypothetical protein